MCVGIFVFCFSVFLLFGGSFFRDCGVILVSFWGHFEALGGRFGGLELPRAPKRGREEKATEFVTRASSPESEKWHSV